MRSSDWSSDVCSSDLELLERVINSEFERGHINESMLSVRDDMALLNRGVLWVTHEDEDGNAVCTEWLDREDFAHDPARCWRDVSWVARRAWLKIGRAHVGTPVTNAHLVCSVLLEKKKKRNDTTQ